jgi:hypothetical protein
MVIPRPKAEENGARPKETSVNPWFTADAVDLFTPVAADETAVIPRFTAGPPARRSKAFGDETTMVVRPKADETAVIPRMRPDESAQPPPRVI